MLVEGESVVVHGLVDHARLARGPVARPVRDILVKSLAECRDAKRCLVCGPLGLRARLALLNIESRLADLILRPARVSALGRPLTEFDAPDLLRRRILIVGISRLGAARRDAELRSFDRWIGEQRRCVGLEFRDRRVCELNLGRGWFLAKRELLQGRRYVPTRIKHKRMLTVILVFQWLVDVTAMSAATDSA